MNIIIKETGKRGKLALIDPKTGLEGFSEFVGRFTQLRTDKSHDMYHVNYHYWKAMLSKEQEGIDFLHKHRQQNDDAINSLIVSDLRAAATYSPIDTINAQALIIKRLKLGRIIKRNNTDGSSSIIVSQVKKTNSGHTASATGDFTITMPFLNENIDFSITLNMLYEYNDADRCVCEESWDLSIGLSGNQEADLLSFLHTALKEEFVRLGIVNCFYGNRPKIKKSTSTVTRAVA